MAVGAGGWLGASISDQGDLLTRRKTGIYGSYYGANAPHPSIQTLSTQWGPDMRWQSQLALGISENRAFFRSVMPEAGGGTAWAEFYHTGNVTRSSSGALSAASPIVRIADNHNSQRADLLEQSFAPAGPWGAVNDEARGVTVQRLDVGVYSISGCLGLAREGWRVQDPCSPDGGRMLGITESEQREDGTIILRLFKQRWVLDDHGDMQLVKGQALDVPLLSWIDVRVQMPARESMALPQSPLT
ncbi:hypothetical protein PspR32_06090 [Pseudomonas sp. R32]|nr:hypothetical protein PspR32_06090 [Pseudomonas sp. R32]